MTSGRLRIGLWLAFLALCAFVAARADYTADLSAFLPAAPTPEQRVLVDQLRDGAVARLILVGIEGADGERRAALSKALAARLSRSGHFVAVANGDASASEADQAWVFENRYLLSPAVDAARFEAAGLARAIGESIELLSSPAGMWIKSLLPRDPTAETLVLLESAAPGGGPRRAHGVWASRDGERALLALKTAAAGGDNDGQLRAIAALREAFAAAAEAVGAADARLVMSGPGVFAANARSTIEGEVVRIAGFGLAIVMTLLLIVYRSPTALLLGMLPVISGMLAGVMAVATGFGTVHGVTLGFGAPLIGEAVDYAIYLFVQSRQSGRLHDRRWLADFWPTARLGVMTSVCGFGALLFSGFPGLAQLGLYAIAGIVTAAVVTRFVLPELLPAGFAVRDLGPLDARLGRLAAGAPRLAPLCWLVIALCLVFLASRGEALWNRDIGALSPVPAADQALDGALRADLGAPDTRSLVVVEAADADGALAAAERVGRALEPLVAAGVIGGFESPARLLPSRQTQLARQAALPERAVLQARLATALADLPLAAERLSGFVDDVERARRTPPLTHESLAGTSIAVAVDALLFAGDGRWTAMLPLKAPTGGPSALTIDAQAVRSALAPAVPEALFLDLKLETDRLYSGYLDEVILHSLAGALAIVALLAASLRSAARVRRVVLPLAAAITVVLAALALAGVELTLLHLVGALLVAAIGSNYSLFFDRGEAEGAHPPGTFASLLFANATTVTGFGLLALSSVPVLHAIGVVVGPGVVLALFFAAAFAPAQGGAAIVTRTIAAGR
jgi:predicted exporter